MVTINTNHSVNIPGGYYTEKHHTDPTTATSAELDAAKAGRFFFQLSDALGSGGRIIGMGSMSFTDTGTLIRMPMSTVRCRLMAVTQFPT